MSNTPQLQKVTGQDCLSYVDKPLGFADTRSSYDDPANIYRNCGFYLAKASDGGVGGHANWVQQLAMFEHDSTKRIVGYVTNHYKDGGMRVVILGNETIHLSESDLYAFHMSLSFNGWMKYDWSVQDQKEIKSDYVFPPVWDGVATMGYCRASGVQNGKRPSAHITFDEAIDYPSVLYKNASYNTYPNFKYRGNDWRTLHDVQITNNVNNTVTFGENVFTSSSGFTINRELIGNPIQLLGGDFYGLTQQKSSEFYALCPGSMTPSDYNNFFLYSGEVVTEFNGCCTPFNLLLTENLNYANSYLDSGAIPPDAYLYPLDWNNLPKYDHTPTPDDDPGDNPNNNDPGDNSRIITPNLPQPPYTLPSALSNYNWYWLTIGDFASFINWFWNDIGDYNDFDDIIAKVKGLYNDVASAILMCRFFPVDVSWIGGVGARSPINVGMIQTGTLTVDTINSTTIPTIQDIGDITIPNKYNSFCDLPPYSQLSLYLPYYGFVDLDLDILSGHKLYVKGLYDYLSGTIQYFLYCDNQFLINSFLAKMAVDIPLTLQTKNDRDSAVFQNVVSTIGGLVGAGLGIASGNPIGMVMGIQQGANALTGSGMSAPLNVRGSVGEQGAFYSPPKCAIILRRPTIQASDKGNTLNTWKKNIGQLCGYGYTLSSLVGSGFTVCYQPRITFTNTSPYQEEIDEIYDYLTEGVIL